MVKISFDASKMDDCAATASAIAGMLRQASSAVSSAYGALDSRVSSRVSGLSGVSSALDSIASEADKLSSFLSRSSDSASSLERSLISSIQGQTNSKLSLDATKAFDVSSKSGIVKKIADKVKETTDYVKSLSPEQREALKAINNISNIIKRMFSGTKANEADSITPEYAQMLLLSGDESQMEQAGKAVSKGSNTEWISKTLFPFLNDIGNSVINNVREFSSIRSFDDFGRYLEHTGATIAVVGNGCLETVMKFGENVIDGINGAFANTSAAQLEMYGALDFSQKDEALAGVAEEIKIDHTGNFWNKYWNTEKGKNLDADSYLKHDGAYVSGVKGAITLGGYVALSLNPVGWAISASSVAGESYEHTLNEGGTLNGAIVAAAPMVILDAGLNLVGGKTIGKAISENFKASAEIVKSGVTSTKEVASNTKAMIGNFTSLTKNKLASESGFLNLGGLFGKGKKASKIDSSVSQMEKSSVHFEVDDGKVHIDRSAIDSMPDSFQKYYMESAASYVDGLPISSKTADVIEDLYKDGSSVLGRHGTDVVDKAVIDDIFDKGLINGGHGGGMTVGKNAPDISHTVETNISNDLEFLQEIAVNNGYGANKIIVQYPKGLSSADIHYFDGSAWRVKPEYVVGYIPSSNGGIGEIVLNPKWYGIKDAEAAQSALSNFLGKSKAAEEFDIEAALANVGKYRNSPEAALKKDAIEAIGKEINDPSLVPSKLAKVEEKISDVNEKLLLVKERLNKANGLLLDTRSEFKDVINKLGEAYKNGADSVEVVSLEARAKELEGKISQLEDTVKKLEEKKVQGERISSTLAFHKKTLEEADFSANDLLRKVFETVEPSNEGGMAFIKKIKSLLGDEKKDVNFVTSEVNSYFNDGYNYIGISQKCVDAGSASTLIHEMGHMLHFNVLGNKIPTSFDSVVREARIIASNGTELEKAAKAFEVNDKMAWKKVISQDDVMSLFNKYKELGYDSTKARELTEQELEKLKQVEHEMAQLSGGEYTPEFCDIVDAVFEGTGKDLKGMNLGITAGHGVDYYKSGDKQFSEMLAQFTVLKVTGNQHDLDVLRRMFGEDFYKMLDDTYSEMVMPATKTSSKTKATIGDFASSVKDKLASEKGALDLGGIFSKGRSIGRIEGGVGRGNSELTKFFEEIESSAKGMYGTPQSCIEDMCTYYCNGVPFSYREAKEYIRRNIEKGETIPMFERHATYEYGELRDVLEEKGFSTADAEVILTSINDSGACSYVAFVDNMFYLFRNEDAYFERIFGYPMYKTLGDGTKVLNSERLLLDIYLFANDTRNGGKLFTGNVLNPNMIRDTLDPAGGYVLNGKKQNAIIKNQVFNKRMVTKFLKSKDAGLSFKVSYLFNNEGSMVNAKNMEKLIAEMNKALDSGQALYLDFAYDVKTAPKVINMRAPEGANYPSMSTATWTEGTAESAGHAVIITGIEKDDILISTYGEKYLIPFEDLMDGGNFRIYSTDIVIKNPGELLSETSLASKTKATVGDFTSSVKDKLASEKGALDLGGIEQVGRSMSDKDKPKFTFEKGAASFDESLTYVGYNKVIKANEQSFEKAIEMAKTMDESRILIEIPNTDVLSHDLIAKIPDNVEVRIDGGFTLEYMQSLKSPNGAKVREKVTYTKAELGEIFTEIEKVEKGINPNWNDYEKALYIYDYMRRNITYHSGEDIRVFDKAAGQANRSKHYDSLTGLTDRVSTCNGYAFIYQELLNRQGIECFTVGGKYKLDGQHAWNIVTIDGNSFYVDIVWDSQKFGKGIDEVTGFGTVDTSLYTLKSYKEYGSKIVSLDDKFVQNELLTISSFAEITEKRELLVSELEQYAMDNGTTLKQMGELSLENISLESKDQAKSFANEVYETAAKREPEITEIMKSLEGDTVHLAGLEHKLKGKESLERKIITDAFGKLTLPASNSDIYKYLKTASDEISDSVRYTLVIDEAEYVDKIKECLSSLEQQGYTINKFKNFWGDKKYQGINVQVVTPDGLKFELQFHTEQSLKAKEKSHFYYDIARNATNPLVTEEIMSKANQVQAMDQVLVKIPEGVLDYKY